MSQDQTHPDLDELSLNLSEYFCGFEVAEFFQKTILEIFDTREIKSRFAQPVGVDHGHEFVEELDDEKESDLPGDDGLEVGREEDPVEVEHEITNYIRAE